MNVEGHIILIIGYENYLPNAYGAKFKLVVPTSVRATLWIMIVLIMDVMLCG